MTMAPLFVFFAGVCGVWQCSQSCSLPHGHWAVFIVRFIIVRCHMDPRNMVIDAQTRKKTRCAVDMYDMHE